MINKKELKSILENNNIAIHNTIKAMRLLLNDGMSFMVKDRYNLNEGYVSISKQYDDTFNTYRYKYIDGKYELVSKQNFDTFSGLVNYATHVYDEIFLYIQ